MFPLSITAATYRPLGLMLKLLIICMKLYRHGHVKTTAMYIWAGYTDFNISFINYFVFTIFTYMWTISGAPNVNFWKYLFGRRFEIQNFRNIFCKIYCLPTSPRSAKAPRRTREKTSGTQGISQDFRTSKNCYNCPFLTDFYHKKLTQNFREPFFWLKFAKR